MYSYGFTKLETPVPVRSLKLSNLGDHSSVEVDAVVKKYCKIPGAEKRGLQYMLLGHKKGREKTNDKLLKLLKMYPPVPNTQYPSPASKL